MPRNHKATGGGDRDIPVGVPVPIEDYKVEGIERDDDRGHNHALEAGVELPQREDLPRAQEGEQPTVYGGFRRLLQ